jgi:hypothetical protein
VSVNMSMDCLLGAGETTITSAVAAGPPSPVNREEMQMMCDDRRRRNDRNCTRARDCGLSRRPFENSPQQQ